MYLKVIITRTITEEAFVKVEGDIYDGRIKSGNFVANEFSADDPNSTQIYLNDKETTETVLGTFAKGDIKRVSEEIVIKPE